MAKIPPHSMKRDYPERPFVGVGVVVWHDSHVLLVKRGRAPRLGQWSIPGGAQHIGETVEEAARREVMEETALEVRVTELLDVIDMIDRDERGHVRHHYTLIDVAAEAVTVAVRAGDDAADAAWVSPQQLPDFDLWDETRRVIALAAARRKAVGL
jgi:ADP-ribose pyrophosphatase YjhB (NUDIX family)